METFDIVLAVAAIGLVAIATAWRDLGDTARFALTTLGLLAVYLVYCLLAVLIVFYVTQGAPAGSAKAVAGTAFVLAWVLWGGLWLIRYVPKNRQPPAFLQRPFGVLGMGLLIAGGVGFAALVGGF